MRYRPEGMKGLLSHEQEVKIQIIGLAVITVIGFVIYNLIQFIKLIQFIF